MAAGLCLCRRGSALKSSEHPTHYILMRWVLRQERPTQSWHCFLPCPQDWVTGEQALIPLAGPANRQGRIAADVIMGK